MNEEYEYSFKTKDIEPFINYCESNNYDLVNEYEQVRTLYKNGGKIMARITKNTLSSRLKCCSNYKLSYFEYHSLYSSISKGNSVE